jgi:SAM-dependent methyltransferase
MSTNPLNEFYDLEDIQLNYQPETGNLNSSWGNLGCWLDDTKSPIDNYSQACQQLAIELGRLAKLDQLSEGHAILDAGFGCGDQLFVWLNSFAVKQLVGINFSHSQTAFAVNALNSKACEQQKGAYVLKQGDCCDPIAWQHVPKALDRIIALDCLYHFKNKPDYFKLCNKHLAVDGILAASDLVLVKPINNLLYKTILKIICKLSHIPFENLMTLSSYQALLMQQGLVLSQAVNISDKVFLPFGQWLNTYVAEMKSSHKTDRKLSWVKYKGTAVFLRWAYNKRILDYQLLQITQLKNSANKAHLAQLF